MGMKFGMEGTFGPLLHAEFDHRCNVWGEKPQNWPPSKLNTGGLRCAMLPVTGGHSKTSGTMGMMHRTQGWKNLGF